MFSWLVSVQNLHRYQIIIKFCCFQVMQKLAVLCYSDNDKHVILLFWCKLLHGFKKPPQQQPHWKSLCDRAATKRWCQFAFVPVLKLGLGWNVQVAARYYLKPCAQQTDKSLDHRAFTRMVAAVAKDSLSRDVVDKCNNAGNTAMINNIITYLDDNWLLSVYLPVSTLSFHLKTPYSLFQRPRDSIKGPFNRVAFNSTF